MVWKAANCLAHTELLFAFGRYALAERTAVIRTLMHTFLRLEIRIIFNRRLLKMVVISTVTMIWIIWLLLMI